MHVNISQQVQKWCLTTRSLLFGHPPRCSKTRRTCPKSGGEHVGGVLLVLRSRAFNRFINYFGSRFWDCVHRTKFRPFSLFYFPLWAFFFFFSIPPTTSISSILFHKIPYQIPGPKCDSVLTQPAVSLDLGPVITLIIDHNNNLTYNKEHERGKIKWEAVDRAKSLQSATYNC